MELCCCCSDSGPKVDHRGWLRRGGDHVFVNLSTSQVLYMMSHLSWPLSSALSLHLTGVCSIQHHPLPFSLHESVRPAPLPCIQYTQERVFFSVSCYIFLYGIALFQNMWLIDRFCYMHCFLSLFNLIPYSAVALLPVSQVSLNFKRMSAP